MKCPKSNPQNRFLLWHPALVLGLIWGMVGCYQMDELADTDEQNEQVETENNAPSSTDEDDSEGNTDTSENPITGDTNDIDYCMVLDGDGDFVRTPFYPRFVVGEEWTMEAWVYYVDDDSALHPVLRMGDEGTSIASYFMYTEYDGGRPMAGIGHLSSNFIGLRGAEPLPTEQWIHMAYTRDTEAQRFWIDGKLIEENVDTENARPLEDDIIIGAILHPDKTGYLNGKIDDVRISRVVRYTDEFTPQKQYALDNDTIVLWNFNTDYGEITKDAAGMIESQLWGDAHLEIRD